MEMRRLLLQNLWNGVIRFQNFFLCCFISVHMISMVKIVVDGNQFRFRLELLEEFTELMLMLLHIFRTFTAIICWIIEHAYRFKFCVYTEIRHTLIKIHKHLLVMMAMLGWRGRKNATKRMLVKSVKSAPNM